MTAESHGALRKAGHSPIDRPHGRQEAAWLYSQHPDGQQTERENPHRED